jgi:hypothetical protein
LVTGRVECGVPSGDGRICSRAEWIFMKQSLQKCLSQFSQYLDQWHVVEIQVGVVVVVVFEVDMKFVDQVVLLVVVGV